MSDGGQIPWAPDYQAKTEVERFQNAIDHIWVAYSFFEQLVPDEEQDRFPMECGRITFRKASEVASVRVELGWAFFTRLEACLKTVLHSLEIKLTKTQSLQDVCSSRGLNISADELNGLKLYRELRNVLHHADGDPEAYGRKLRHLEVESGHEPQLMRQHVEAFYRLFRKVGAGLTAQGVEL